MLPSAPGDVYGDSAFASSSSARLNAARGGWPRTVQSGVWGGPEALVCMLEYNTEARRVRARILSGALRLRSH